MVRIGLARSNFKTGDFLLQGPFSRCKIEPTARTRIMDTPASEVTSLLLDWKIEGRAVEPRLVQRVLLDLKRPNLHRSAGGARRLYPEI
jgi:hypothetical protein